MNYLNGEGFQGFTMTMCIARCNNMTCQRNIDNLTDIDDASDFNQLDLSNGCPEFQMEPDVDIIPYIESDENLGDC